ncbi:putative calpain-like cysteine peptidase [Leishmania major strain Friedlin]|uniref:Putative calpain-like cysteine peptidase n=1 Tax=Leishmania major TaxID=5664 RepID=Q4Q6M2_LEIMA|nr:putative calpain-like cysteine peptidase [Leishmania major strain Friedlin]CAG9579192.1 calpain-like_cysteine_peptidase_-_putative [Leishmania major strain Friedlin]CAJ08228.1 putative calpain-like cysteine peptidase [Leishmania major strain Friedlin]|eukprot:XP_001685026.1 putative calpain-like cysteine peptidase [Leishmania major strain Friedlin]
MSSAQDEFDETTIHPDSLPVPATWRQKTSVFRYCGPSVAGAVSSVIDEGVLYRIITDGGGWAFYNDTRYYTVQVRYRITAQSPVTPGHSVTVDGKGAQQELSMELGPEETKVLLTGSVVGFENLCKATLLPRRAATTQEDQALCAEPQQHWSVLATSCPDAALLDRRSVSTTHLVARCVEKQIRYVDLHFFPSHASLYRDGQDSFYIPPLHWRLPASYLPRDDGVRHEVRLFHGPILHPDGLHAGHLLPNHLLLSVAIGLTCLWPQALRCLFIHPQGAQEGKRDRAVGAYHVRLCTGGWWRLCVLDEFFPASAQCPEFSHCADDLRVLWLPLLEKACAKSLGSYAAMLGVPLEYFVRALTGGPCTVLREIWPAHEDLCDSTVKATRFLALMKRLLLQRTAEMPSVVCWLQPHFRGTARTQHIGDRLVVLYEDIGLDPNIATVVLGLETLGDGQCVARLRQTAQKRRSAESWLDLWRRAGKSWVDEVSDLVFAMEESAGDTVWMALEDLPQYFQGGCVAPLTSDWGTVKVQGEFMQRQPSVVLEVTVTAPTRLLASVTQRDLDEAGLPTQAVKLDNTSIGASQALAGLSCLLYAKGSGDSTHFYGSSGSTPDAFEVAQELHFAYEREVTAGHLLDPRQGPYYVAPFVHAASFDVAYTITVQLIGADSVSSAAPLGAPESSTARVRFMTAKRGTALFQNLTQPILLESSMEVSSTAMNYQSHPPGQLRLHCGSGVAVDLVLSGRDVPTPITAAGTE